MQVYQTLLLLRVRGSGSETSYHGDGYQSFGCLLVVVYQSYTQTQLRHIPLNHKTTSTSVLHHDSINSAAIGSSWSSGNYTPYGISLVPRLSPALHTKSIKAHPTESRYVHLPSQGTHGTAGLEVFLGSSRSSSNYTPYGIMC